MDFWHHVLSAVQKQVSRQCFDTWFKPIFYQGHERGVLRLTVPNLMFRTCLLENYAELLLQAAGEAAGSSLTLQIDTAAADSASSPTAARQHV